MSKLSIKKIITVGIFCLLFLMFPRGLTMANPGSCAIGECTWCSDYCTSYCGTDSYCDCNSGGGNCTCSNGTACDCDSECSSDNCISDVCRPSYCNYWFTSCYSSYCGDGDCDCNMGSCCTVGKSLDCSGETYGEKCASGLSVVNGVCGSCSSNPSGCQSDLNCSNGTSCNCSDECSSGNCSGGTCQAACPCTSGDCCDGCNYRSSSYVCDYDYATDYGCPDGTGCGYDVKVRYKTRNCSGTSSSCSGTISDWGSWSSYDDCSVTEYCTDDDSTCNSLCSSCNGRTATSNAATLSPTTSWQTIAGSLASGTDTKRYAVSVTTTGTHEFSLCSDPADGGTASYDSYLCLLNSSGGSLTTDDDSCGTPASAPRISYNFTSTGTYYIQVSGYSTNYGTYTLAYRRILPNQAPSISSVTDSPDPVTVGSATTFSVSWSDPNAGDNTKIHICKTNAISGQTCSGGSWCDTASWSSSSPTSCSYTTTSSDLGTQNYYAFTCDDDNACSSATSGSFSVGTTCNNRTAISTTSTLSPTTSWQTIAGSLASGTDTKRYAVSVTTTGTHEFSLCSDPADGGTASYDSYLCLLNSSGGSLTTDDDSCGTPASAPRISYNFTSTGTYYIQVSGYSTNYGTYTLAYRRRKIATQITDFSFDPATISLGQQTAVRGWLKTLDGTGIGGQTLTLKYYGVDDNYHDISPSQSGSTGSTAPNVGYLGFYWTPSSTYLGTVSYRLEFAENSTYESSVSSTQNLIVNQPVCSAPGNFRCTTITEKSIKIVWDAVSGASLYEAEWCKDGISWGSTDCCPAAVAGTGTCNATTSSTEITAPNLMYNTLYNFRVRVKNATGCVVPGTWANTSCTTSWPECGAGCSTKDSGTNCGYSYGAIGSSCIVGGLDNHGLWMDVGVSECYDAALVCKRDVCPSPYTLSQPETLLKLGEFNDGATCNVTSYWKGLFTCSTLAHAGVWDKSEYKCVRCSTDKKENIICGDTSGVYTETQTDPCTKTGDSQCEAGCGASSFCDEKINSHYYKTSETRLDWCVDCYADYTLCDTYTECDSSDPENFGEDYRCYYTGGGYHWGSSASVPATETECLDGHDNDCDGYTDCDPTWPDPDCPCDTTPPTSKITGITPVTWNTSNLPVWLRKNIDGTTRTYTLSVSNSDNAGGSGLDKCELWIYDTSRGSWVIKNITDCGNSVSFTVGSGADCQTQEDNKCTLWVRSWDERGNYSSIATAPADEDDYYNNGTSWNYLQVGIDWTPPVVP